jgi:hypothetical protein
MKVTRYTSIGGKLRALRLALDAVKKELYLPPHGTTAFGIVTDMRCQFVTLEGAVQKGV